jgi:hypothetical protein
MTPKIIAEMLTDDPDVFHKSVVLAVHPNFVVDAAQAASSKFTDNPGKHGPHRLKILKNYVNRFKRFISGKQSSGATIIITLMGDPYSLDSWYDEIGHWEKADPIKMGMEQEEVYQLHQDLMDFIYQLAAESNVYVIPEKSAGAACRQGKLDHILDDADEMQVIGGNLKGCLNYTVKSISKRPNGPSIKIVKELSFDDNMEFWDRNSK